MIEQELTVFQVAESLGVSVVTVRRWIRDRRILARRYGHRTVRVPVSSLRRFQQRKTEPARLVGTRAGS